MKKTILIFLALLSIASYACSEADDDNAHGTFGMDAGAPEAATANDAATPASGDAGAGQMQTQADGSSPGMMGTANGAIVINEISGKGDEWIEIVNAGTSAVDLSGYSVTDGDKEGGAPKMSDSVVFPAGTVLSPNAYVIVGTPSADAGPSASACPAGPESYCVKSSFGISNKDGDNVFVLDKSQAILVHESYPANVVTTGQTWGRLPNATGAFQVTQPTPGATNEAP